MSFQSGTDVIRWHIHLRSPIHTVYQAISTDSGRASFWAEMAVERNGIIHFVFPNQAVWDGEILLAESPHRYTVRYYGGSTAAFVLEEDGRGGTDLALSDSGVPAADREEVIAGWVSVLLALKAAVDFGVDLRNHDPSRGWDQGYADN